MNELEPHPLKRGTIVELDIVDFAFGGKGIARVKIEGRNEQEDGEMVVFVENTIPGQKVQARITRKRSNYGEGKLLKVLKRSKDEEKIPYQSIPGAPYATLNIEKQRAYKEESVLQMMERLGKVENVREIYKGYIESPSVWHYRNKMEYSFSNLVSDTATGEEIKGFALGFKRRGQWWAVENLEKDSGMFDAVWEDNLHKIRTYCHASGLPAWNPKDGNGFFRFLTIRKSFAADKFLISFVTTSEGKSEFDFDVFLALLKDIMGKRLAGLWHWTNDDKGDRVKSLSGKAKLLYGSKTVQEELCGLKFDMSMESFFQTNPKSAEKLYTQVAEYALADAPKDGVIMDLFCGTGTIGQMLAKQSDGMHKIIGVDIVPEAIDDAKANAKRNDVENVEFFASDVGTFLSEHEEYTGNIHTIVLDPPRAGIAPKTLEKVIELGAQKLVYVSCNPATQARDIQALRGAGYEITEMHLVDQFPHTAHVETIAVARKIK